MRTSKLLTVISIVMTTGALFMCNPSQDSQGQSVNLPGLEQLIASGQFTEASAIIDQALSTSANLSSDMLDKLKYESARMVRIRRDFRAKPAEVLEFIQEYYPDVTDADIRQWEATKALEYRIIDGEKLYFNRAARNLFRIDKEMRVVWDRLHPDAGITSGSGASLDLDGHLAEVIKQAKSSPSHYVLPKRIRITQSVEVDADAVPDGELVRCWIPYPRWIPGRQEKIDLLGTVPREHLVASPEVLQRTIYFEKPARAGEPTTFSVEYEMTALGSHHAILADQVTELEDAEDLGEFLREDPPHIVFSPALRALSDSVVGLEQNPYRKAQLLYAWIDENIPWASAREYSTIRCIPDYAFQNGHGDCGIQTLLFMTLCRMNGIPTRWQSGWELQPPDDSMHDWGLIYFEPYGWVPMDITYGLRSSPDEELKWFYLSGMDSYRIIFNDGYSHKFEPPKEHLRSETLDSQRGEVEWAGGNLYFDKWSWDFQWLLID